MKSFSHEADVKEIITRLRRLRPDSRRRWGRMTPHQMLCHLCDSFRLPLGEKAAGPTGTVLHRTAMKFFALHTPIPWPHDYRTRPEMDQEVGGTPPVEFERDREELARLIARFIRQPHEARLPHPIFGPMSEAEWLHWGWRHADHHLRQFGV